MSDGLLPDFEDSPDDDSDGEWQAQVGKGMWGMKCAWDAPGRDSGTGGDMAGGNTGISGAGVAQDESALQLYAGTKQVLAAIK